MESNILFAEQNIYTLTPLLFGCLVALMIITKKVFKDIILTIFLFIDGFCSSLMLFGYWEEALIVVDIASVVLVFYSIFRKRVVCNSNIKEF